MNPDEVETVGFEQGNIAIEIPWFAQIESVMDIASPAFNAKTVANILASSTARHGVEDGRRSVEF